MLFSPNCFDIGGLASHLCTGTGPCVLQITRSILVLTSVNEVREPPSSASSDQVFLLHFYVTNIFVQCWFRSLIRRKFLLKDCAIFLQGTSQATCHCPLSPQLCAEANCQTMAWCLRMTCWSARNTSVAPTRSHSWTAGKTIVFSMLIQLKPSCVLWKTTFPRCRTLQFGKSHSFCDAWWGSPHLPP